MALPAEFYRMTESQQIKFLEDREANKPKPGELTMHVKHDQTGREIREFTGPKSAWMDQFKGPMLRMIRIDKHARGQY